MKVYAANLANYEYNDEGYYQVEGALTVGVFSSEEKANAHAKKSAKEMLFNFWDTPDDFYADHQYHDKLIDFLETSELFKNGDNSNYTWDDIPDDLFDDILQSLYSVGHFTLDNP